MKAARRGLHGKCSLRARQVKEDGSAIGLRTTTPTTFTAKSAKIAKDGAVLLL